jgi:hypothetical protein
MLFVKAAIIADKNLSYIQSIYHKRDCVHNLRPHVLFCSCVALITKYISVKDQSIYIYIYIYNLLARQFERMNYILPSLHNSSDLLYPLNIVCMFTRGSGLDNN